MDNKIILRSVQKSDLEFFYKFQLEKEANFMAAFVSKDRSDRKVFDNHWEKILSDKNNLNLTIEFEGEVVGNIAKFLNESKPEITYWIGKEYWGKGIATQAVTELLKLVPERPIYARVAKDNIGSNRVLEKTGFIIIGEDKGFAEARGKEIKENIRELK